LKKQELMQRKAELEKELENVTDQLLYMERMEKPFEAVAVGYSGRFSTFFKTEEQARKKTDEYYAKTYFRNGRLYSVSIMEHQEDGTKKEIEKREKK
jgi:hypothetical protein